MFISLMAIAIGVLKLGMIVISGGVGVIEIIGPGGEKEELEVVDGDGSENV